MRRLLFVAAMLGLAACDSSTDYVGLTFQVSGVGFDWSRVSSIAVDLDDGESPIHAEAEVENGTYEIAVSTSEPSRVVIARVVLRDVAGGEVAAGATPPFVPLQSGVSTLRVVVVPHNTMTPLPDLLPESRSRGFAMSFLSQYVLTISGPGDGPAAELYDGLTHSVVPELALPDPTIVSPRGAEIGPGTVLVLDDAARAQLYVVSEQIGQRWVAAMNLAAPHDGPTPGACVTALPEGGALIVGGRDAEGAPSAAVTHVDQYAIVSRSLDPLPVGLDGCRLVAFGSAVLVLPAVQPGVPYPDVAPILYDVSSGASAVLTGPGAGATSAARLADGSLLLVHREGALFRLAAQPSGDVEVAASDYLPLGSIEPARIAPDVFVVGKLGLFVLGGMDEEGEDLDGGLSFAVDVTGPGSLTAVPPRGSVLASLPDVGVLVLGGPDAPDRVMLLRP